MFIAVCLLGITTVAVALLLFVVISAIIVAVVTVKRKQTRYEGKLKVY